MSAESSAATPSRRYCRPECADPYFQECADCWRDGGNPALYPDALPSRLLESSLPAYHSEPAELLGREGMVTVWDDLGRYVGCMGVNLWRHLLTVSGGPVDG